MTAHTRPPSKVLRGLLLAVPLGYVASPAQFVVGNLVLGDLWFLSVSALVLISKHLSMERVWRELYSPTQRIVALLASISMLSVAFMAGDLSLNLKEAGQFLFIVWIFVPIAGASTAQLRDPLRYWEIVAWCYSGCFCLGLVLLFEYDKAWLVQNAGPNRFHSTFGSFALKHIALCVALARLATSSSGRFRMWSLLGAAVAISLFSATRTDMVIVAIAVIVSMLIAMNRGGRAISTVAAGLLAFWLLTSTWIQDRFGVLVRDNIFEDSARMEAVEAARRLLAGDMGVWLVGAGWGSSGRESIVVHNIALQVLIEAGGIVAAMVILYLLYPIIRIARKRYYRSTVGAFALLLSISVIVYWSLNAVSIERRLWLSFAVAGGALCHVRLAKYQNPARQSTLSLHPEPSRGSRLLSRPEASFLQR